MEFRHIILALILPTLVFGVKSGKPNPIITESETSQQCPGNVILNPGEEIVYECTGGTCDPNFSCEIAGSGTCIVLRLVEFLPTSTDPVSCSIGPYLNVSDTNVTSVRKCDPTNTKFFSAPKVKLGFVGGVTSIKITITTVNCPPSTAVKTKESAPQISAVSTFACKGNTTMKPGDELVFNCTAPNCKFNCEILGSDRFCPVLRLKQFSPTSKNTTICSSGSFLAVSDKTTTFWRLCEPSNTKFVSAPVLKIGDVGNITSALVEVKTVQCSPSTSVQTIQSVPAPPKIESATFPECKGTTVVHPGDEHIYKFDSASGKKFGCEFKGAEGLLIAFKFAEFNRPNAKSGCRNGPHVVVSNGGNNTHMLCNNMPRFAVMSNPLLIEVAQASPENSISFVAFIKTVEASSPKIKRPPPKAAKSPKTPKALAEIAKVLDETKSTDPKTPKKSAPVVIAADALTECIGDVLLTSTSNLEYQYTGEGTFDCTFKTVSPCTPAARTLIFDPASADGSCSTGPYLEFSREDGSVIQRFCLGTSARFITLPAQAMHVKIVRPNPSDPTPSFTLNVRTANCSSPSASISKQGSSKLSPGAPVGIESIDNKKPVSNPKGVKPVAGITADSTCFGDVILTSADKKEYNYTGAGDFNCVFKTSAPCIPAARPLSFDPASADASCPAGPFLLFSREDGSSSQRFCLGTATRFITVSQTGTDMRAQLVQSTPPVPAKFFLSVRTANCAASAVAKKAAVEDVLSTCEGNVMLTSASRLNYTYTGEGPFDCNFETEEHNCTPAARPFGFTPASINITCPSGPYLLFSRPDGTSPQKFCVGQSNRFILLNPDERVMHVKLVQTSPETQVSFNLSVRTACKKSKPQPVAPVVGVESVTTAEDEPFKTCSGVKTIQPNERIEYRYNSTEGNPEFNCTYKSSATHNPCFRVSNFVPFGGGNCDGVYLSASDGNETNRKICQSTFGFITMSSVTLAAVHPPEKAMAFILTMLACEKPPTLKPPRISSKTARKPNTAEVVQDPTPKQVQDIVAVDPATSCQGTITMEPGEVLIFEYDGDGLPFDCLIQGNGVQPGLISRSFDPLSPANSDCSAGYLSVTNENGTEHKVCSLNTRYDVMQKMKLKAVPIGTPLKFNLTIKAIPKPTSSSRVKKSIHSFKMPVAFKSNVETLTECIGDHQLGRGDILEFDFDSASGKKFDCTFWGKDLFEPCIDIHSFPSPAGIACSGDSFLALWDGMNNSQRICHETPGSVTIASQMMMAKAGKHVKFRATVKAVPGSLLDARRAKTVYPKNAIAECLSGTTEADEARIVNGEDAEITSFPWQCGIEFASSGKIFCGCSLINSRWILTAAHCCKNSFMSEDPSIARILFNAEKIYANEDKSKTFRIDIKSVRIHPLYDQIPQDADYCLCEMKRDIDLGALEGRESEVRTARLPCGNERINLDHENLTVSGYGLLGEGKQQAAQLQKVVVPVVPNEECQKSYGSDIQITSNMLCAGYKEGGKDACQGDSGGPLVIQKPAGAWTQVGVVSWGIGCAEPNMPGAYARIEPACPWIFHVAGSGTWCADPK